MFKICLLQLYCEPRNKLIKLKMDRQYKARRRRVNFEIRLSLNLLSVSQMRFKRENGRSFFKLPRYRRENLTANKISKCHSQTFSLSFWFHVSSTKISLTNFSEKLQNLHFYLKAKFR